MPDCSECYFFNQCEMDEYCDDVQYLDENLFAEAEIERLRIQFREEWFQYMEYID